VQSPTHTSTAGALSLKVEFTKPALLKPTDSTEEKMVYFTVGDGDEDLELGGEEALDSSAGISKRDIHTLNEQRRRDVIKVGSYVNCYTRNSTSCHS